MIAGTVARFKRASKIVFLSCLTLIPGTGIGHDMLEARASNCNSSGSPDVARQLFAFQAEAISQYKAGQLHATNHTWRQALDYARAHCWQSVLSTGDHLLSQGQARKAFVAYAGRLHSYDLLPGGYSDLGAVEPFERGLEAGAAGDFSGAIAAFRSAIGKVAADPGMRDAGFPEADFMLGVSLFAEGQRAQAVQQWRQALLHTGPPFPEEENFGPPSAWVSALNFYVTLDP